MSFVPHFGYNHLSQEISYWVPTAQVIRRQLTQDFTYAIARGICFNPDMTFRIKMLEDWGFGKRLPQLDNSYSSFGS